MLDRASGALRQLGAGAAPSTLMFAKFSPDGRRVGYVRERDLYVEDVGSGAVTRLTKAENEHIVNGTSDWVYEEELDLRDAFRWSPDGRQIAYWQFDTTGIENFTLINDTDSIYPVADADPVSESRHHQLVGARRRRRRRRRSDDLGARRRAIRATPTSRGSSGRRMAERSRCSS